MSQLAAVPLLAALLLATTWAAAEPRSEPLTEESVVRWFVAGVPTEEIVSRIRSGPASFDLSEEMLVELRAAGLPETVIRAMLEVRDEETAGAATAAEPTHDNSANLAIAIDAVRDGPSRRLRLAGLVEPWLVERFRLEPAALGQPFDGLAVFLLCRTATHVPDHWRSRTPLGRDFVATPRHRMLAFVSSVAAPRDNGSIGVELDLPETIEVHLDAQQPHDLSLGLAVAIEERYYSFAESRLDGLELGTGLTARRARIGGDREGSLRGLEVRVLDAP